MLFLFLFSFCFLFVFWQLLASGCPATLWGATRTRKLDDLAREALNVLLVEKTRSLNNSPWVFSPERAFCRKNSMLEQFKLEFFYFWKAKLWQKQPETIGFKHIGYMEIFFGNPFRSSPLAELARNKLQKRPKTIGLKHIRYMGWFFEGLFLHFSGGVRKQLLGADALKTLVL